MAKEKVNRISEAVVLNRLDVTLIILEFRKFKDER